MTPTPTKPSAAERAKKLMYAICAWEHRKEHDEHIRLLDQLTAIIEAHDLWRAEALAAQEALGDQPEGCWEKLAEARAARLAKGLT